MQRVDERAQYSVPRQQRQDQHVREESRMLKELAFLASEITTLEALLAEIPAENVIDRWSLQARLEDVREEFAALTLRMAEEGTGVDRTD